MTLPPLTIIPAGAGSGKTYRIQNQLAEWLAAGLIAPERIVAVTFTEAAASDLRARIREQLVGDGQWAAALRLDQAYISTIHGFGLRLLSEMPFEVGISPILRMLSEDEARVLISNALPRSEQVEDVMLRLADFGYTYDHGNDRSGEDVFRSQLLRLIGLLRQIGREAPDPRLAAAAREGIVATYGTVADPEKLDAKLRVACQALLASFPNDLSGQFPDNKSARTALRRDHGNLAAAATGSDLGRDWGLWSQLGELRCSVRGSAMPDGYDDLAEAVIAAASRLPEHPGPRDEAIAHVETMLSAATDCIERYGSEKRERSLVDYTDMVAGAYDMLIRSSAALAELKRRVDCLVIDEFQDTNPIQFSLLWALHRAGVPALVVGDTKQAIMGFQGADARLFDELERSHPRQVEPLRSNWRTCKSLMPFLNALSARLFEGQYDVLEPEVKHQSSVAPVEVVVATSDKVGQSKSDLKIGVAARIAELLGEERPLVWDRETDEQRPIRGEDIAVLCLRHKQVQHYAEALRDAGVRARIAREGWFESRAVQLAYHALAYVADPDDLHAALYLTVTELGRGDVGDSIARLLDGHRLEEPILSALDAVREGRSDRTVCDLLDETIAKLQLWDRLASWSDADQSRANLLRLSAESRGFVGANREAMAASGFYGADLKTFLAWLPTLVSEKDKQPEPRVRDEDAVEVRTWHSAKGREWPVVVVATTYMTIEPRLPDASVEYESFDDLDEVLDRARIAVSPSFDAKETNSRFEEALSESEIDNARRLLYVALTRPREKLILEWPSYVARKDYFTFWSLLNQEAGLTLGERGLLLGDDEFECVRIDVESLSAPLAGVEGALALELPPRVGRRALRRAQLTEGLAPESVVPSSLKVASEGQEPDAEAQEGSAPVRLPGSLRHARVGDGLSIELGLSGQARGDLLHRCYEVLSGHPERAQLLTELGPVPLDLEQRAAVAANIAQFDRWLETSLAPASVQLEVPVLALDDRGSVVWGYVDVLAETADGLWIVDHKSDRTDDRESRFVEHLPQLSAYAEAVAAAKPGTPVIGVAIHWITYGEATLLTL